MKNLILMLLFLIAGCQQSDYAASEISDFQPKQSLPVNLAESSENSVQETSSFEQMLIKTAHIDFQVHDVAQKHQEILNALNSYGAYVVNDNSSVYDERMRYSMQIKVPKQNFDAFLNDIISGVENVDRKSISVEDVTEEFVDIQSRLNTKKQLEQRYLQLLAQATQVSEMLEIEKQIGELQADIESIEGRLKYLQQQVEYSTLNLNFYEKFSVGIQFGEQFKNGFKNGWNNFIWFFVGLTHLWPFMLFFILGMVLLIRYARKKNRKSRE